MSLYNAVNKHHSNRLLYLCASCRPRFLLFVKAQPSVPHDDRPSDITLAGIDQKIDEIREKIEEISNATTPDAFSSVLKRCNNPEPFRVIQQQQEADMRELSEIEARRLNVIIFSQTPTSISKVCEALDLEETDITEQTTLNTKGKVQPIKIRVASERTKWHIISQLHKKLEQVYARPDLTPKQQQKDRELVKELQEMRKQDDGKKYKISRGRIVELKPQSEEGQLPKNSPSS